MLIVYIALFALAFYKCKVSWKGFFAEESLSKSVTDSVKGIFIWLVFLSHFASYVTYTEPIDQAGGRISVLLGQLIVACFLMYSGYGVCESIKKKGSAYVRTFPKNRVLKTLLHFALAVIIFWGMQLCLGNSYSPATVLLSLIGWENLGNSNWYIFVVLVLYLITWLAFVCFKNNQVLAVSLATVLTGLLILFLYYTRSSWWYDTALCYVLGMWLSVFKNRFLKLITKNNAVWLLCAIGSLAVFGFLYFRRASSWLGLLLKLSVPLAFCVVLLVFLTKIRISNKILAFCGQYLFELYILQRIPMILFKHWGLIEVNLYLYFALCLVATLLLALGFRFCTDKIDGVLFRKNPDRASA